MRRPDKKSKHLIDRTWVPATKITDWRQGYDYMTGEDFEQKPQNIDSLLVNPNHPKFKLSSDEVEMMKSGASLQELLFMRLLMQRGSGNNSLHPDLWNGNKFGR